MRLLFQFLLVLLLAAHTMPAASGSGQDVLVSLFRSKPAVKQILISGGCRLIQPTVRNLTFDRLLVKVSTSGVQIMPVRPAQSGSLGGIECGAPFVSARRLILTGLQSTTTLVYAQNVRRSYRGDVIFERSTDGYLDISNRVSRRDYVNSVVGSETNPDFPEAELEAQAIMAQTLLARYKPGDALSDTTETEAYLGAEYERPLVRKAVNAGWNKILTYQGRPIDVYFHSTCAGGTSNGAEYFGLTPAGGYPYLEGRQCSYCKHSPFWQEKVSVIPLSVYRRQVSSLVPSVTSLDERKRPLKIQLSNNGQSQSLSGFTYWTEIGQKLGWDKVPGTRFSVTWDAAGDRLIFRSTGAGHGVGLCQWGAKELARGGKTCEQILQFYFPGVSIQAVK